MIDKKKITIGLLTLVGLITTIKLAIIYYNANFDPYALSSFCSINEFIDCDGIAKTTESQFIGVPLALWGMFLYAFIFVMLFIDKLKNIKLLKFLEVFKNPMAYIAALGIISFTISMILLVVSLFEIKKLCVLCAFTYILNLLIGLIAANKIGFVTSFKQSFNDFKEAVSIKKYTIAFIVVALFACGILAFTKFSYILTPQVKRQDQFKEFVQAKTNKYAISGNVLGDKDAKLILHAYTDYRCPMCHAYNIMIHKLAKELKGFKVIHHNMPLDTECNKYLRQEFHKGSCMMAKYAIAAEEQGHMWDMNNVLFEKQPNTEEEILEIAKKLNLDIQKLQEDAHSLKTQHEIQADISSAYSKGINGTPSTMMNGKTDIGIKPYKEMKAWVINEGATER